MSAEIFLIAPTDTPPDQLVSALTATLERDDVAALLLPRGNLAENAYKELAKRIVPLAQSSGAAVLVESVFGLVGVGSYLTNAVAQKDTFAVLGGVLVIGVLVVVCNYIVDVLQLIRDPRLRAGQLG